MIYFIKQELLIIAMSAMTQAERNELSELKYKEQQGTITPEEQTQLDFLRENFQCE
jgi:hypothetical protein